MRALTLAICIGATCAQADTFAERWPHPIAVEPMPIIDHVPVPVKFRTVRKARAEQRFACHRIHYTHNRHRYWRCKR